jgi:hypothetical protein
MKRLTVCLISCIVLAGSGWMAHNVLAQAAEAPNEKTFTVTQSKLDKYVAEQIAKAVAADREKSGRDGGAVVSDEQVLRAENWHRAVFNKAEWVVYTGPGQAMFHHWVPDKAPPKSGAGTPATQPAKGN